MARVHAQPSQATRAPAEWGASPHRLPDATKATARRCVPDGLGAGYAGEAVRTLGPAPDAAAIP